MTELQQITKIVAKEVDIVKFILLRYFYETLEFTIIMKDKDVSGLPLYRAIPCSKNQADRILKKFLRKTELLGFGVIDNEDPARDYMTMTRISDISAIVRDDDTIEGGRYIGPCVKILFNENKFGKDWTIVSENRCLRKSLLSHQRYDLLLML